MISVEDALALCLAQVHPLPPETVPLARADGRVLATEVAAAHDQPPFAASAMDGFAVRAADLAPGAVLAVVAEAAAGHGWAGTVAAGQACRILTGAPVPAGADYVVIQENVVRSGDRITVTDTGSGPNIRAAGTDFTVGHSVAPGLVLTPAHVALIAAMNAGTVAVTRRPDVAIVSTGDELVWPGEDLAPDRIVASNVFALAAMLRQAGATPRLLPIARDTDASLHQAFDLAAGADLIVTVGGASVGDHDLVAPVAAARGIALAFHRIAMRPGKPLMAGRGPDAAFLGLPGNPVSAIVCGHLFLLPMVRRMLGLTDVAPQTVLARTTSALPANGDRAHYMRCRTEERSEGRVVTAADRQDSALLSVLSGANGLLIRPPHAGPIAAGTPVPVLPI